MRFLIIRHGEPDYAHDSLTERGFREAELLAQRLQTLPIAKIYCSTYGRAQKTAAPTAARLGLEPELLPWLREFSGSIADPENPGKQRIPWNLPPRFWTQQPELFDRTQWRRQENVRDGSMAAAYDTVTASFDALLASYGCVRDGQLYRSAENPDCTLAFFCHFGLGMVLASHLMGISPFLMWQGLFLPTSSVTTFVTEEREKGELFFKCMQMGDTSHLTAEGWSPSPSGLYPEFYGGAGQGAQV